MFRSVWKSAYETGHPRIDFEHRIFLDLILQIETDLHDGVPLDQVERHIVELYKYTDFHFFSEESIMIDVAFPDLEAHRRNHELLLAELKGFTGSISLETIRKKDIVGFLIEWFSFHTAGEDIRLAAYVRDATPAAN